MPPIWGIPIASADRSRSVVMTASPRHLEGIAREIHDLGIEPPVDAFVLAGLCGVDLRPGPGKGSRTGDRITYPSHARPVRQHGVVAHELGHWLLERAGQDASDEPAARYLAGALMLPRAHFLADVAATDWDLFALQERHPNASAEMIVVRLTQVSEACASVWDQGSLTRHYASADWLVDLDADRELVSRVLACETPLRPENEVAAWPIFSGRERRVIVVRRAA